MTHQEETWQVWPHEVVKGDRVRRNPTDPWTKVAGISQTKGSLGRMGARGEITPAQPQDYHVFRGEDGEVINQPDTEQITRFVPDYWRL